VGVEDCREFQETALLKIPLSCLDGKLLVVRKISTDGARLGPYICEREECLQPDLRSQISDSSVPA
jgi:hypothetical protein